ncbi:MAG: AraC family transcriptional regulator, partial [Maritimibacter sp.]|nr:AraC family transcriptional regulator [Maritimibacter sp.]
MPRAPQNTRPNPDDTSLTRRYVFVLLDDFTLLSFAGAVDALRLANRQLGRKACTWIVIGESGTRATCSAGTEIILDGGLGELKHSDTVIVCGGEDVQSHTTKPLISWLRREARRGVAMGAFCTGAHALAEAGLLDGKRATIHWENYDGFSEDFPEVDLARSVYVIDGNRMTT